MKNRDQRVDDLIRLELSRIVLREVKDPRVKLASVTNVSVSKDLRHAVVLISALGEEAERLETVAALNRARGFIRTQLARATRLRTVPELGFKLDRGAEYSQRMNEILESLHDSRGTGTSDHQDS